MGSDFPDLASFIPVRLKCVIKICVLGDTHLSLQALGVVSVPRNRNSVLNSWLSTIC